MKSYMMSQSWKTSDSTKNRKKQREKNFTCSEALHISVRRSTNFADAQYRLLQHRNHALRVLGGAADCADLTCSESASRVMPGNFDENN